MKLYTREELQAMPASDFAALFEALTSWAFNVLGEISAAHGVYDMACVLQQKKLVVEAIARNTEREQALMGTI